MNGHDQSRHLEGGPQVARRLPEGARLLIGRRRQLFGKIFLVLAGTVVGLALAELAVSIGVLFMHRHPLIKSDMRAGWALRPNLRGVIRAGGGGQYAISTDSEGHRITHLPDVPAAPGASLIVVGDSYIQSVGADDSQTFAWILAHEMPVNVVNLGVLGYGTDQQLLSLEAFLESHPSLEVRDVVAFVTENDFTDVQIEYGYLGRHKPRFRLIDGRLDRGDYRLCLSDRLMDMSYLYWLVNSKIAEHRIDAHLDPAAGIDVVVACLAAMRDAAGRRGARFHVLVHHLTKVAPLTEQQWADFRRRTAASDITDRLRPPNAANPIGYDGFHWSFAGHQRVAAIVKERLEAASKKAMEAAHE